MKNRKGEVVTLLTIGALVVIGVTAAISSLGLNKKTSTNTRASTPNICEKYLCSEIDSTYTKGYWYMKESSPLEYSNSTCTALLSKKSADYCKALNVTSTPIPVITGVLTNCTNSDIYTYYVCGGKWYEDQACKTAITNKTNWCKYGQNNAPSATCGGEGKDCCTTSPKCADTSLTCDTATNKCTPVATGGTCEKGEYFEGGAGSWSTSTPEQICAANNGTYIPKTQKQVGDKRAVCCAVGNVNSQCPQVGLGYACCVQDNRCTGGTNRYRWYGCTGQVCSATIINTQGGPGHLVDCPVGVTKANPEKCEQDLAPAKPSEDCTDNGSYGLLGGCKEKCTATGYECLASPSDPSGEKRFCCKAPDPITPNNCTTKNPSSTYTYACVSSGEDASEACNSQTGTMAGSVYDESLSCGEGTKVCCKKAKDPGGGTATCEQKYANCSSDYAVYQGTDKFSYWKSKSCTGTGVAEDCYSISDSTNCKQSTWNEVANYYCKGTPIPGVSDTPPSTGKVQTSAASDITGDTAKLNGSFNGSFDSVGFTFNGKKITATAKSPFSSLVTGLTPNTSYSYNTYGVIDGKEVSGTSVTFKTLEAAYNPKNADYERLGTLKVAITLTNAGQRNISEERARFKMNVGNAMNRCDNKEFVLNGTVLTSECATLERFDMQKTQSPTYVDVWYSGRAGIDTQSLYHGTETFIADQFEKTISLTYDFGTITKNFSINISTTCTSLLIPAGGISIKGVVGGMPKTDQKITADAPYTYNGVVDSTKELNTLVISGATCESSKGTGLSFLDDKEYTKAAGTGNNFVAIVNE